MTIKLTNIPTIMRHQRWHHGAKLLESWFGRRSTAAPAYDTPDTTTISMDWVRGYDRARTVYDRLVMDRIWSNAAARGEIAKVLKKLGRFGRPRAWFGDINVPAPTLDASYINYRIVSSTGLNQLDGLTAALGNFSFRVAIAGEAEGLPSGETRVHVWQVGVYVRDSFDFEGDQFLGYWDDSDNSVSTWNFMSGQGVSNQDFRAWRRANGKGGDYLVYSNVHKIMLPKAEIFVVQ